MVVLAHACGSPPPKSPSTAGDDLLVHRAENKPTLVHIERQGDATWALAATVMHGGNTTTSIAVGESLQAALQRRGYSVAYRAFPYAVALIFSLGQGSAPPTNPLDEVRLALHGLADAQPQADLEIRPPPFDLCGLQGEPLSLAQVARTVGKESTVFAVVGEASALDVVNDFYASAQPWPAATGILPAFPAADVHTTVVSSEAHELVVARRTPERSKVAPAARHAGDPESTLALLAHSFPGEWQLVETHSSYVPGGGCVAVRLVGGETQPLLAARAARAIGAELEWILDEQVEEEDPRLTAIEATSAEEAATRAAWMTLTQQVPVITARTAFVRYAGTALGSAEWQALLTSARQTQDLPLAAADEPGQGRIWALLSNPCSTRLEGASDAGHAALALAAAARSSHQRSGVEAWLTTQGSGLVGNLATRSAGTEDMLAEDLARVLLRFVRDSSTVVAPRAELIDQLTRVETWDFALRLATDGHPSWLVPGPTQHSLMQLGPLAAHRAARRFAAGPLHLAVLSNQGPAQSERLRQRLQHLLSGLRDPLAQCPDASPLPSLSGEYEVAASQQSPAVMVYTVDAKYADAVRALANRLNAPGGWLARALNETSVSARARAVGLGTPHTLAALGFAISGEDGTAVEQGIAQVRALVARLRTSASDPPSEAEVSLTNDPRLRLAALLREQASLDSDSLSELLAHGLSEQRLVVVKALSEQEPSP